MGQKQLIEIVKALSKNSNMLVLDEPTAALGEHEVLTLLDILRDLRNRGIASIYVSHKLDELFAVCDRITVLRDGGSVAAFNTEQATKAQIIKYMVGRELGELFPRRRSKPGAAALEVEGLSVTDGDFGQRVLTDISFSLHVGEVMGIGGLMGAGRTELLMHLFGAWGTRLSGSVRLNGRELRAQGYNMTLGGGVNLTREPRNGRTFEYMGEDPILAGTLVGNRMKCEQAQHLMGDIGQQGRIHASRIGDQAGPVRAQAGLELVVFFRYHYFNLPWWRGIVEAKENHEWTE